MNTIRHEIKVFEEQVSELLSAVDTTIQKFRNILESFADLSKVKVLFDDYSLKIRDEIFGMKLSPIYCFTYMKKLGQIM